MTLEERLEALENANTTLTAKYIALRGISITLLMHIPAAEEVLRKALNKTYDIQDDHMDAVGYDSAFQAEVRAEYNGMATNVLAGHKELKAASQQKTP